MFKIFGLVHHVLRSSLAGLRDSPKPGSRRYERHIREEVEHYAELFSDSDRPAELVEPAPAAWNHVEGLAAARIRAKTGNDLIGHVVSRLNAREGARMLSLGSGPGGLELAIARQAPGAMIRCLDVNPTLLALGREQAEREGLAVEFAEADINSATLPEGSFELVFCHASLHHVLELEHVVGQIDRTLFDGGEVVVADLCTRNGYRMWPETREAVEAIWETLPEKFRVNHTSHAKPMVDQSIWGMDTRIEGMECARSEDVLPLLERQFETVALVPYYALCRRFFNSMYGPNYRLDEPLDRAIVDWIWNLDVHSIETEELRGETFFGIFRRRG